MRWRIRFAKYAWAVRRQLVMRLAMAAMITTIAVAGGEDDYALASTVMLSPGDNIQNAVNTSPPGTIFILQPGVYRENSVTSLQNGDTFTGQPGAILDGAKLLTSWNTVSLQGVEYWTTPGGIPLTTPACTDPKGTCCQPNNPGCMYVQNLYVDNIDYKHVTSLANVVSGAWYYAFDSSGGAIPNNVYLFAGANPNSHIVELSDQSYAFRGTAANITINNLTIEKYAAPLQSAAVTSRGPNWLIQNNEIRLNHGYGVKAQSGANDIQVVGNNVHDNGEAGIGAGTGVQGGLWHSNYVVHNNIDHVLTAFEGGGTKFCGNNTMISNNIVHSNDGPGLWTDVGGTYNTYYQNTSYNNSLGGIRYEISRWGTITNNIVFGNTGSAQIEYTGSDHGRISGNHVTDNGIGGILVYNIIGTRPNSTKIIYEVTDTQVTNNTIVFANKPSEEATGLLDKAQPSQPDIFSDSTNVWTNNTYVVPSLPWTRLSWEWGENAARPGQGNPVSLSTWLTYHPQD